MADILPLSLSSRDWNISLAWNINLACVSKKLFGRVIRNYRLRTLFRSYLDSSLSVTESWLLNSPVSMISLTPGPLSVSNTLIKWQHVNDSIQVKFSNRIHFSFVSPFCFYILGFLGGFLLLFSILFRVLANFTYNWIKIKFISTVPKSLFKK